MRTLYDDCNCGVACSCNEQDDDRIRAAWAQHDLDRLPTRLHLVPDLRGASSHDTAADAADPIPREPGGTVTALRSLQRVRGAVPYFDGPEAA